MSRPSDSRIPDRYAKSLDTLEARIEEARCSIQKLHRENSALKKEMEELRAEKRALVARTKELQQNAKRAMLTHGRMKLARTKIQEIIRRIEQVESEGDLARSGKIRRRV